MLDTVSIDHIKSKKIVFLGNVNSKFFKRCSKLLPFRASGDIIFINDTSIVTQDFVIHCNFIDNSGGEIELIAVNDFESISGVSELFGYDFTISRK